MNAPNPAAENDPVTEPPAPPPATSGARAAPMVVMIVSVVLILVLVGALLFLIFVPPDRETVQTMGSLRLVGSLLAGVAGAFFGWSVQAGAKVWRRVTAVGTGGGGAFVLVFVLFYVALPEPGPDAFTLSAELRGDDVVLDLAVPSGLGHACRSVFLEPEEGPCVFDGTQALLEGERCALVDLLPVRVSDASSRSRTVQVRLREASGGCRWRERLPLDCGERGTASERVRVTTNCPRL